MLVSSQKFVDLHGSAADLQPLLVPERIGRKVIGEQILVEPIFEGFVISNTGTVGCITG